MLVVTGQTHRGRFMSLTRELDWKALRICSESEILLGLSEGGHRCSLLGDLSSSLISQFLARCASWGKLFNLSDHSFPIPKTDGWYEG